MVRAPWTRLTYACRYSIPFFLEGSLDAKVQPVTEAKGDYPRVEDFMRQKYDFTYVFEDKTAEKGKRTE